MALIKQNLAVQAQNEIDVFKCQLLEDYVCRKRKISSIRFPTSSRWHGFDSTSNFLEFEIVANPIQPNPSQDNPAGNERNSQNFEIFSETMFGQMRRANLWRRRLWMHSVVVRKWEHQRVLRNFRCWSSNLQMLLFLFALWATYRCVVWSSASCSLWVVRIVVPYRIRLGQYNRSTSHETAPMH